jgi:DNA-binding NtrC family response regulator
METLRIVLYQNDPRAAQNLAVSLSQHFESVHVAGSCREVRLAVARQRADVLVLDLETSGPAEVERLHHEFPHLCIVGTHRLADDEIWTEALNRGASDICEPRQKDVVRSVLHSVSHGLGHHAAA